MRAKLYSELTLKEEMDRSSCSKISDIATVRPISAPAHLQIANQTTVKISAVESGFFARFVSAYAIVEMIVIPMVNDPISNGTGISFARKPTISTSNG